MNKKICVYKGCQTTNYNSPELTFFQFPRDQERLNKWIVNGDVTKEIQASKSPQFFCELHFDKIYIVPSQRRKLLLQSGVPYHFSEYEKEELVQIIEQDISEIADEENVVEYVTVAVDDTYNLNLTMKRKNTRNNNDDENVEKKPKLSVLPKVIESQIDVKSLDEDEEVDEKTIEDEESPVIGADDELEEFIFKGQEYVQLSKVRYEGQAENYKKERHQILEAYRNIRKLLNVGDESLDDNHQSHDLPIYSKSDGDFFEFIFRGEEYVQLPKDKYFERRKKLQRGVSDVKFVLKQIRNQLLSLNLD